MNHTYSAQFALLTKARRTIKCLYVSGYVRQHSSLCAQFGAAEPDLFATFEKYLKKISDPCEEVGDFVLNAI